MTAIAQAWRPRINHSGKRFGMFVVLGLIGKRGRDTFWLCRCECGSFRNISTGDLPTRKACGCTQLKNMNAARWLHGESPQTGRAASPEYRSYTCAKARCTNPSRHNYHRYGGRGIKFLFTSFKQFLAEVGRKPSPLHTLDRKETDGHYAPGNVRWATPKEQSANRGK